MAYILLKSAKNARQVSRAYTEYSSRDDMAKPIVDDFEEHLKLESPIDEISYTTCDLFKWIDEYYEELVCLERQPSHPDLYIPYQTTYVKEVCYVYLRGYCGVEDDPQELQSIEYNVPSNQIAMEIN